MVHILVNHWLCNQDCSIIAAASQTGYGMVIVFYEKPDGSWEQIQNTGAHDNDGINSNGSGFWFGRALAIAKSK